MKKIIALFLLFSISGCVTSPRPPKDQGVSCANMTGEKNKETCIFSDTYIDKTEWHFLRPWEEDSMGDMPDI